MAGGGEGSGRRGKGWKGKKVERGAGVEERGGGEMGVEEGEEGWKNRIEEGGMVKGWKKESEWKNGVRGGRRVWKKGKRGGRRRRRAEAEEG